MLNLYRIYVGNLSYEEGIVEFDEDIADYKQSIEQDWEEIEHIKGFIIFNKLDIIISYALEWYIENNLEEHIKDLEEDLAWVEKEKQKYIDKCKGL